MAYIGQNAEGNFTTTNAKDRFSGDGSTTTFTLSQRGTENNVDVFVNNVRQEPGVAYNIEGNGTSLVFTAAPSTGTNNIYVVNRGPAELSASHPATQNLEAVDGTFTGDLTIEGGVVDVNGNEIILDADGDTSITADTDDQIDFKTGGSDRMVIDSDGHVGIGTSSVATLGANHYTLEIDGKNTSNAGALRLRSTDDSVDSGFWASSTATFFGTLSSHPIQFRTNNTERMRIDSDGKVGIGTNDPSSKVTVAGGSGSPIIEINRTTTNTVGAIGALNFTALDGHSVSSIQAIGDGNNEGAHLVFRTTSSAGENSPYGSNTFERVRIASSGAVSIAASSGSGYLSVQQAYNGTTGSAANMHILSNGNFLRSTSSGRYKTGVEDAEMSYAEELYNLRPVYYKSLGTFDNPNHGHWGFIAEEVAEIDPRLCLFKTTEPTLDDDGNTQFDDDGNLIETTLDEPVVEGVQYDRMIPLLLMLLKAEKDKVEALETRIAALEANQ